MTTCEKFKFFFLLALLSGVCPLGRVRGSDRDASREDGDRSGEGTSSSNDDYDEEEEHSDEEEEEEGDGDFSVEPIEDEEGRGTDPKKLKEAVEKDMKRKEESEKKEEANEGHLDEEKAVADALDSRHNEKSVEEDQGKDAAICSKDPIVGSTLEPGEECKSVKMAPRPFWSYDRSLGRCKSVYPPTHCLKFSANKFDQRSACQEKCEKKKKADGSHHEAEEPDFPSLGQPSSSEEEEDKVHDPDCLLPPTFGPMKDPPAFCHRRTRPRTFFAFDVEKRECAAVKPPSHCMMVSQNHFRRMQQCRKVCMGVEPEWKRKMQQHMRETGVRHAGAIRAGGGGVGKKRRNPKFRGDDPKFNEMFGMLGGGKKRGHGKKGRKDKASAKKKNKKGGGKNRRGGGKRHRDSVSSYFHDLLNKASDKKKKRSR